MLNKDDQILIVEDDHNDAFLIRRAFTLNGVKQIPFIATDGQEAVNYLSGTGEYADRRRFPMPHLVLTDLKMPRMNGFELLQWLKDHPEFALIPTVVLSSSSDPSDVKRAYCLGANAYLCKANDFTMFNDCIGDVLRFWRRCERPKPDTRTCQQLGAGHHSGLPG